MKQFIRTRLVAALVCATALLTASLFMIAHAQSAAEPKKDTPGLSLGVTSVPNLRDVGGYRTCDGLVVGQKLLYRSSSSPKSAPVIGRRSLP